MTTTILHSRLALELQRANILLANLANILF